MRRAYVIGSPIAHSISPVMHNAAFAACGIDARYEAVHIEPGRLAQWVAHVRSEETLGFNVTLPHKEAIIPLLDELQGDAQLMGAVNTVKPVTASPQGGRETKRISLVGKNTDISGFRRSLQEEAGASLQGQRVLLLGAGGAARAIALTALQDGAEELWVANRHPERAQRLLNDLAPLGGDTGLEALDLFDARVSRLAAQATVVVNATSVGLRSQESPLGLSPIRAGTLVVDVVYNPPETAFLRAARQRGARVLGGVGMLVYQAAVAFEEWTGMAAPLLDMRGAAERALSQ